MGTIQQVDGEDSILVIPESAERDPGVDANGDTVVVLPEVAPSSARPMRSPARSWAYAPAHRGTRSLRAALRRALDVTFFALAVLAVLAGVSVLTLHLRLQPVLSGSMRPGIQPGDLAITRPVSTRSLEPGDVIAFYPPGSRTATLHRITSLEPQTDGVHVVTKGDANDVEDPWGEVVLRGETAWRLVATVPKVGYLPVWTRGIRGPALIATGALIALSALLALRTTNTRRRAAERSWT